jgi:hypothetical protein
VYLYYKNHVETLGEVQMTDRSQLFAIEKRQRRRWELVFYLRTFDQSNDNLLGHIVDIHEEGLMLLSETPIELNKDYNLTLEMPISEDGERKKISLRARSVWQSSDANPDLVDTGFQLIDPDRDSIEAINELIEELQF